MMKVSLNYKTIHPRFKLNGITYDFDELKDVAYHLIKGGQTHEKHIGNFLKEWVDPSEDLNVQTSGSTGAPKTISLKKQFMVNSALATGNFFTLKEGKTALLCLSAKHIAGKMMLVRAMILGLELDYVNPSSNPLEYMQKAYDFCAMVPLQLQNSLNSLEKINKLIIGGAPMSIALKKQVQNTPAKVFETYGMTETITHVAVKRTNHRSNSQNGLENCFIALPDVRFSKDERDCLVISAPNVSASRVITNDIIDLLSETAFKWLGRFDNVINSGGVKLFPEQIEAKLASLIKNPFFVAGSPDAQLGQQLILVVEGTINSDVVLDALKENTKLNRFEIPKVIYQLPDFMRTDTGKIRREKTLGLLKG